jgi:hypothetical protein
MSKIREGLDALNDQDAATVEAEFEQWKAARKPPPPKDYSSMTNQEIADEAYRIERERAKGNG